MLAVFMQELPHRIGDYAVLVNAGMTPFQVSLTFFCIFIKVNKGNTFQFYINRNGIPRLFDRTTSTRQWCN